jgi:hypothetical protein
MDKKQLQACVDYINKYAAQLHGVPQKVLDVGEKITVDNVVESAVHDGTAYLVVDRGIKGTPKYVLDLKEVESDKAPAKSAEAVEAEAKKVDEAKAKIGR